MSQEIVNKAYSFHFQVKFSLCQPQGLFIYLFILYKLVKALKFNEIIFKVGEIEWKVHEKLL